MTCEELIEEVRLYLGDEAATTYGPGQIKSAANACLRTLWFKALNARPDHGETSTALSTVLNNDRIVLPADFMDLLRIEYAADQAELFEWDWPKDPRLLDPDQPWEYRIEAGQLIFRQPAKAVYSLTLYYLKLTPKLSADTDVHGLPEFFDQILVERTAKKLGARLDIDELDRDENAALNQFARARTTTVGYRKTTTRRRW